MSAFRVAVLASGTGTNLQAILDHIHGRSVAEGGTFVEVVGVGSDKPEATALRRAAEAGIACAVFAAADYPDRATRDSALGDWLEELEVDLVVLAGYMQLLGADFLARFPRRVINVHPALLPAFPGIGAVEQAVAHGAQVFGVTVHCVDEGIDTGPIIVQRALELPGATDAATVRAALRPLEHDLLCHVVQAIARGDVELAGSRGIVRPDDAAG